MAKRIKRTDNTTSAVDYLKVDTTNGNSFVADVNQATGSTNDNATNHYAAILKSAYETTHTVVVETVA